ncbi:hypothetical protein VE00_00788 [Pseudogymnoascus sp. WSF 3629]|nr:hypothetical protein VE00_00788 [Pseudogymnoascus sp. WSF 3629]
MSYYGNSRYGQYDNADINRLPSGLFFTVAPVEHREPPANKRRNYIKQKEVINDKEIKYDDFVIPTYNSTKTGKEIYLPMLEVSVEVEVVATIAWSKLTQTFTNRSKQPIKEATYCMPLYDKSTVTSFVCTIGSDKILKGTVKPKEKAKAEFKEAIAKQQVAALLEEHTPEVFETNLGNIPAKTTVKVEISYITELKADLGGDGVLVTIPTSVAPRYGAIPSSMGVNPAKSLAVPENNGLQIKIQVSSPVAITKIESRTHPVSIEMGSHGTRVTKDIRDFSKKQESQGFDPKKAVATLSDRNACLGKDFVLLIQANDGQLLASRAISEPHPTIEDRSALMVSINLRDLYTPNVVSPKTASEIIFVADRSGSMEGSMEALKTAMKIFLKSLPNNCIFNICSFGTTHRLMWPKSQPYNQRTVDSALTYIANHFSADMGGTEIQGALRHVVEKSEVSVATEIITLTDGSVWDTSSLFDFIQKTRSTGPNRNTRFFCLGIGEAVSHHLVAGISRYGGGLAEVVPTDSSGDWMGRVIGMLRAALTPSSWTVDITLDGVSISSKESENKRCIQAPHQIPDFHAFSRSSIYFLLNQEFQGKVVKIKATSVSSGETFTAEIPIEKSDIGKKWVHQLAAKAVLGDLESGQSWIHDRNKNTTNAKIKTEADELAKIEGEKIGIEWNISSKWTSFIVVDEKSLLEKQSRWYQAGHSDLSDLTRPRFEPRYQEHAYQGAYKQSPARQSFRSILGPLTDLASRNKLKKRPSGGEVTACGIDPPTGSQSYPLEATVFEIDAATGYPSYLNMEAGTVISSLPNLTKGRSMRASGETPSASNDLMAPTSYSIWNRTNDSEGEIGSMASPPSPPFKAISHSHAGVELEQGFDFTEFNHSRIGEFATVPGEEPRNRYLGKPPSNTNGRPNMSGQYQRDSGDESDYSLSTVTATNMAVSSSAFDGDTTNDQQYLCQGFFETANFMEMQQITGSRSSVRRPSPPPGRAAPGRPRPRRDDLSFPNDPDSPSLLHSHSTAEQSIPPPTLSDLLTTQHILGYFDVPWELQTQLQSQYTRNAKAHIEALLTPLVSNPTEWLEKETNVLNTIMVVAYIEKAYAADNKLWSLVVQKARAWLAGVFPDKKYWRMVFKKSKRLLLVPVDKEAGKGVDGVKGVSPAKAGTGTSVGEQQEGQGKKSEAGSGENIAVKEEKQNKKEAVDKKVQGRRARFSWIFRR